MRLCLNMIVRNEADRIIRCLESAAPHIHCAVILDTGSTDLTIEVMREFFEEKNIPFAIHQSTFKNWEQARNEALAHARALKDDYDYILLMDADMELKVDDPNFADGLTGQSYDMIQKGGTLSYHNRRLVRKDTVGWYKGVTHEYLDIPAAGMIHGAYFIDHGDGANRPGKFKRDIALLLDGLKEEPNNARYMFYLARSYHDDGQFKEAVEWYDKRVKAGGWDEEVWYAQYAKALCYKSLDDDRFASEMLKAYSMRPSRAESLHELARHYREKPNEQQTSLLFSQRGLWMPKPADTLFVSEYVYNEGLRHEFSICAFYGTPGEKLLGRRVCDELSLDKNVSANTRWQAKNNLYFYLPKLSDLAPGFLPRKIEYPLPKGWTPMNPSVVRHGDQLWCNLRAVNYVITPDGRYDIDGKGSDITSDNPIMTRNFLLRLDPYTLGVETGKELNIELEKTEWDLVLGAEDVRLYTVNGCLAWIANIREANPEGWCEQWAGEIFEVGQFFYSQPQGKIETLLPRRHEKNWMPVIGKDDEFVYCLGKQVTRDGTVATRDTGQYEVGDIRGGSQAIPFDGGYLCLVHEAGERDGQRYYQHRFVKFDDRMNVKRISLPFVFHDKQIEFAAGLSWFGLNLIISYGVKDKEAWIAYLPKVDVREMLE